MSAALDASDGRRFVLIRPGALGDALLALPALRLLRLAHPAPHVTFVARSDVLPIARTSALADAVSPYDAPAWSALFADDPHPVGQAAAILRGADAVAWLADPAGYVQRNLPRLGAARALVAPGRPPDGVPIHAALHLARILQPLGIAVPDDADALALPPDAVAVPPDAAHAVARAWDALALPPDARVLALHPGSGGAAKRWPPERFAAVADAAPGLGLTPLLLEGPADADITAAVLAATTSLPVARDLSPAALLALLRRCAAYLGNDSGATHLAALAGIPVLALFGPTDPAVWRPLGRRAHVLRAASGYLADLATGDVLNAIRRIVTA